MNWICASCGLAAKTNRQKCSRCGGAEWRPTPRKDSVQLGGPIKRIAPKGLLLAGAGKQAPALDPSGIECGICHNVIYKADKGFDAKAFQEAKKTHYAASPACENQK